MVKSNSYSKNFKKPSICVVGPGVVGLATGIAFLAKGYKVTFIGRTQEKVERLRRSGYAAYTAESMTNGSFSFDIVFLTVPTPTHDGKVNLGPLRTACAQVGTRLKHTKNYQVVVVKSTVPPGTTRGLVKETLEKYSGKKAGVDFGLCMNPEYLREKSAVDDSLNPWAILIGELDKKSGDVLKKVYAYFDCPLERCTLEEAEMQKYVHNLYNAAKITFFNEMRQAAGAIGANSEKMFKLTKLSAEAMWNPSYGVRDMGPFSGACLPKDTQGFYAWAQEQGMELEMLKSVIKVNNDLLGKYGITKEQLQYTL